MPKNCSKNWSASYWVSKGATPSKLILGMATYGRCFTLRDPADNGIGAPVNGPCPAAPFTREAGFLSYYEVRMSMDACFNLITF